MNEVIHAAANVDLDKYLYTAVYASAAATPTINGTAVPMVAGSTIMIRIKSISATANIFVIGRIINIPPTVING